MILFGDTLGDPSMADGMIHVTNELKIGFLNFEVFYFLFFYVFFASTVTLAYMYIHYSKRRNGLRNKKQRLATAAQLIILFSNYLSNASKQSTVIQAREELGKIEVLNIKFLLHHLH